MRTRPEPMTPAVKACMIASCAISGAVVLLVLAYLAFAAVVDWALSSLTW